MIIDVLVDVLFLMHVISSVFFPFIRWNSNVCTILMMVLVTCPTPAKDVDDPIK